MSNDRIVGYVQSEAGQGYEVVASEGAVVLRCGGDQDRFAAGAAEDLARHLLQAVADIAAVTPEPQDDGVAALTDELAHVFHEEGGAKLILSGLGYSRGRMPAWTSSSIWWAKVVEDVKAGATTGGIAGLARAARRHYPANDVFRQYGRDDQ